MILNIFSAFPANDWTDLGNFGLGVLVFPFIILFLFLDGITYSLVGYAYKLFELMARLNFSSLISWVGPVIERIQALIIVIIMFVIGYSLIQYLIDPEKSTKDGSGSVSLVKNIAITAVLLIVYQTAFTVLNEVTFLLIGAPDVGTYEYNYLNDWFGVTNDGEPGLISNLIFGNDGNDATEENVDFGTSLAVNTLHIFLHSRSGRTSKIDSIYNKAIESNNGFNLMSIVGTYTDVNIWDESSSGAIEYKFPVLSTGVGLYLLYTLVMISIELGVRALKLVILQILAPLAIVTIIKDGWKSDIWQKWLKLVGSLMVNVFVRVGSMYFVIALISTAWNRIGDLFSDNGGVNDFTYFLLLILVVVSGFKLAKELPKFIDSIFGTHLADSSNGGFGKFLSALGGGIMGGTVGFAGGIGAGRANGLSGFASAFNGFRGAFNGVKNGTKSKNFIDMFKNASATSKANRENAETMASRGGTLRSNIGFGFREVTGTNYRGQKAVTAQTKDAEKSEKAWQESHRKDSMAENKKHFEKANEINKNIRAETNKANAIKSQMEAYKTNREAFADQYSKDYASKAVAVDSQYQAYAKEAEEALKNNDMKKYDEAVEKGRNRYNELKDVSYEYASSTQFAMDQNAELDNINNNIANLNEELSKENIRHEEKVTQLDSESYIHQKQKEQQDKARSDRMKYYGGK